MGNANEIVILSNESVERSVIGSILRHNELYTQNRDILSAELFRGENVRVFSAIKRIINNGGVATPVSVSAELSDSGVEGNRFELQRYVALADVDSFQSNVKKLDDYYKRNAARLIFLQMADEAVKMDTRLDDTIERADKDTKNLMRSDSTDGIISASEAMRMMKQHVMDVRDGKASQGIMTGFRAFDSYYGIHEDQLVIIAARTGVGKTALAMNISANVAKRGVPVSYYSSEMGALELWARIMSYGMEMRSVDILHNKLSDHEINRMAAVADNYEKYPLYIDEEASVSFDRMMRSIRKMVTEYGVKVVVVDYLQIVRIGKKFDSESQKFAYIARELKNIAKELHIVVIALSQLNRVGVKEGVISKSSLRNSGELEEAADTILLIDRPDADLNTKGRKFEGEFAWVGDTTNKAVFKIDKGRSTGCAEYLVDFIPEYTMFLDNASAGYDIAYEGETYNTDLTGDDYGEQLPF